MGAAIGTGSISSAALIEIIFHDSSAECFTSKAKANCRWVGTVEAAAHQSYPAPRGVSPSRWIDLGLER